MEIPKGYLETTMFNLFFDENRPSHVAIRKLFDAIRRGEYDIYTSQYVVDELEAADEPKRTDMLGLITEYNIKVIDKSDEIVRLAQIYIILMNMMEYLKRNFSMLCILPRLQ
ncbi:MAG: hypothetical protein LBM77_09565 [Spirochaetaceae bacterium]|jgi:predicted nucleic acid-binding protein|nr:hypothetical protein [Spirochaetaceae bacterium]